VWYGRSVQYLKETNPADRWLETRMSTQFRLGNGHVIILRYDVASTVGAKRVHFDADKVWSQWSKALLGDGANEPAHAVKLCEAIESADRLAGLINQKLHDQGSDLIRHVTMSHSILDALYGKQWHYAKSALLQLAKRLMHYEPRASEAGWGQWIVDCTNYLENSKKH